MTLLSKNPLGEISEGYISLPFKIFSLPIMPRIGQKGRLKKKMKYMAGIYWQTAKGEPVSKAEEVLLSAVAQTVFVPLYNKVIDIVNPWYEVWNHMFDELHPGVDGNSKTYQDYIADRTNEVIKGHNQSNGVVIKYEIVETEDYVYEFVGHFMTYRCFIRLKPM